MVIKKPKKTWAKRKYSTTYSSESNKINARGVRMSHGSMFRAQAPLKHVSGNPIHLCTRSSQEGIYIRWEKWDLPQLVSVDKSSQIAPRTVVVGAGREKS